jgi:hypothetical protein
MPCSLSPASYNPILLRISMHSLNFSCVWLRFHHRHLVVVRSIDPEPKIPSAYTVHACVLKL